MGISSTPAGDQVQEDGESKDIQYFLFIQQWGGNFKRYVPFASIYICILKSNIVMRIMNKRSSQFVCIVLECCVVVV